MELADIRVGDEECAAGPGPLGSDQSADRLDYPRLDIDSRLATRSTQDHRWFVARFHHRRKLCDDIVDSHGISHEGQVCTVVRVLTPVLEIPDAG